MRVKWIELDDASRQQSNAGGNVSSGWMWVFRDSDPSCHSGRLFLFLAGDSSMIQYVHKWTNQSPDAADCVV